MSTNDFFTRNNFSDLMDGVLPEDRAAEMERELGNSSMLKKEYEDFHQAIRALEYLREVEPPAELSLALSEMVELRRSPFLKREFIGKFVAIFLIPLLFAGALISVKPEWFPAIHRAFQSATPTDYERYYPLHYGAGSIVAEQASWLTLRDSYSGNMLFEGGFSPDEFEKAFQLKSRNDDAP